MMSKGLVVGVLTGLNVRSIPFFAEVTPPVNIDPLGGWASLILQGGAFVLLTYMITVLIPKEMKLAREERERQAGQFKTIVDDLNSKFDDRNGHIVNAVEKQSAILVGSFDRGAEKIFNAVNIACKHK